MHFVGDPRRAPQTWLCKRTECSEAGKRGLKDVREPGAGLAELVVWGCGQLLSFTALWASLGE